MSRNNSMYKEAFNRSLEYIGAMDANTKLLSENELTKLWGISRTTVRAVLSQLDEKNIIRWQGRNKVVLRQPQKQDYFAQEETISTSEKIETQFMEYVFAGDLKPGTILQESDLVREFGVSTSVVREFLIQFSRFGLIEKTPNRHWVMLGFTRKFAIELFEIRKMFELHAIENFFSKETTSNLHRRFISLETAHMHIIENIDEEYLNFPRLDELFHRTISNDLNNRFVDNFFELITVIFHYHYRWDKFQKKHLILEAAQQHMKVIQAVKSGDKELALSAFNEHLQLAKETLLEYVLWDD